MEGGSFESCLVIDNGTYSIKAGINGNDRPSHSFMNLVGQPLHDGIPGTAEHTEACKMGGQIKDPSLYRLERPMERGVVRDWDLMSQVWNHMYYNELRLVPDEHAVLMTEIILAPKRNREKAAEILFETFNVPALQFASPLLLGMYSIGKTTGVSIDIGEGYSSVTPIYEGFVLQEASIRVPLAGKDISNYLGQRLLPLIGHDAQTSAERLQVYKVKESVCFVNNYAKSLIKGPKTYQLPSGETFSLDDERHLAPELLFNPIQTLGLDYRSLQELIVESIGNCPEDLQQDLYGNLSTQGGTAAMEGLDSRVQEEVSKSAPQYIQKVSVASSEVNKSEAAWRGGSTLTSLSSFAQQYIQKRQYEENGLAIIDKLGRQW